MKKTYGVSDLLDWTAVFGAGRAKVNVRFTGGARTKYGITPAEFTTCDPMIQSIIEGSEHYQNGRISLLREVKSPLAAAMPMLEPLPQAENSKPKGCEDVEISCIEDGIEYLKNRFRCKVSHILTREQLIENGVKRNINFIFQEDAL